MKKYRKKVLDSWRTYGGHFSPVSTTGHHCPSVRMDLAFEAKLECGHIVCGSRKIIPKVMTCYICKEEKR